jgi:hypothetical protein
MRLEKTKKEELGPQSLISDENDDAVDVAGRTTATRPTLMI